MNIFEKFINFFEQRVQVPLSWGLYHIIALIVTAGLAVLLSYLMRNSTNKGIRIFLFVVSTFVILLEIMKQSIYSLSVNADGTTTWDYQWYAFPFQFCSMPMYIGLIASLLKPGKVQDALFSFLASFSILAGVMVMFIPQQVFCDLRFINFQTMVCHGSMIIVGAVLLVGKHVRINLKTILKGGLVFSICALTALFIDCLYVWLGVSTETFNMFFISPYFPCTLPVFDGIYTSVPYVIFLFLYIFAFTLGTFILMYAVKGITMLVCKLKR